MQPPTPELTEFKITSDPARVNWSMPGAGFMLIFLWLVASTLPCAAAAATFQTNTIEGWQVLVHERLLKEDEATTKKALELLRVQLQEIVRVVPTPALAKLREVPLWFSPPYPGVKPTAEYHPGAGWLRDHGRDPAMAKGVEFTNVKDFEAETQRMPNFTLHELAHGYHDRVLPGGFGNPEIKAAYERAKASKSYEQVERWFGNGRPNTQEKAYAMTNPMEYFAETTEAFFSRNDFFPFTRDELKKHDPEMFKLLEQLWSPAGPSPGSSPERLTKVKDEIKQKAQARSDAAQKSTTTTPKEPVK